MTITPEDLQRALARHPVKLRNGHKGLVAGKRPDIACISSERESGALLGWDITIGWAHAWREDGYVYGDAEDDSDIVGLWENCDHHRGEASMTDLREQLALAIAPIVTQAVLNALGLTKPWEKAS